MAVFDTLGISGSGLMVHRKWLDAVSDNISNVNTVRRTNEDAFQERFSVAQSVDYGSGTGGVRVARAEFGSGEGRMIYQPDHPLADAEGYVTRPQVDLSEEMTHMVVSQRLYQANLSMMQQARDTYQSALTIGKGR